MKGFFAKLKDFSPKLKVIEIQFLEPQTRWKKPKWCYSIIIVSIAGHVFIEAVLDGKSNQLAQQTINQFR